MTHMEYMHVIPKHSPLDIIESYNTTKLVALDGYVYIKIKKGIYGLKQATILAYQKIVENLSKYKYTTTPK